MQRNDLAFLSILLATALTFGCSEKKTSPAPESRQEDTRVELELSRNEHRNVMAMMNGAVVTDRSGELNLQASAVLAIDSTHATRWVGVPKDLRSWLIVELPVRSRIERLTLAFLGGDRWSRANKLQVDASLDGKSYSPLATISSDGKSKSETFPVTPMEARFIRVTTLENLGHSTLISIGSIGAEGEELEARREIDISGTWLINEHTRCTLAQRNSSVVGTFHVDPPVTIVGDLHRGLLRFMWIRANQAGYGALSVNAEASRLSGIWWHERPLSLFFGDSWFGRRTSGDRPSEALQPETAMTALRELGRFTLYPVRFDAENQRLIAGHEELEAALAVVRAAPKTNFHLAVFSFAGADAAANQKIAEDRARALAKAVGIVPPNLKIAVAGSKAPRQHDPPRTPLIASLYDRTDLELNLSSGDQP